MTVRCDRCGDESNSAPGLMCGRVEEDGGEPCQGTYQHLGTMVFLEGWARRQATHPIPGSAWPAQVREMHTLEFKQKGPMPGNASKEVPLIHVPEGYGILQTVRYVARQTAEIFDHHKNENHVWVSPWAARKGCNQILEVTKSIQFIPGVMCEVCDSIYARPEELASEDCPHCGCSELYPVEILLPD